MAVPVQAAVGQTSQPLVWVALVAQLQEVNPVAVAALAGTAVKVGMVPKDALASSPDKQELLVVEVAQALREQSGLELLAVVAWGFLAKGPVELAGHMQITAQV